MSGAFLLLHRAIRNAGDALIYERARSLIAARWPEASLDSAEAWRPLGEQIDPDRLARYRAVVICGGPGYAPGLHQRYPLGELGSLPPVVPLALGSFVVPGTHRQLARFRFDPTDRAFLDAILRRAPFLGARDPLSAMLLEQDGFDRVLMTGDPVWYDLEAIDRAPRIPAAIRSVALTPPANPAYFHQALRAFRGLARDRPDARVVLVHHRGVQRPFASLAARRSWEQVDITGSVEAFAIYDRVDMHVGYRVHAHLYASSRGVLSYLLAEDSRGSGVLRAMPGLGWPAFDESASGSQLGRLMAVLPRIANAHRRGTSAIGAAIGPLLALPDVRDRVVEGIRRDEDAGFPAHVAARDTIRRTLPTMQRMIDELP